MTKKKINKNKVSLRQKLSENKRKISKILIHALLLILVVIDIFPLYWMITFSLKDNNEIKGYKKEAENTRWEEIEEAIIGITGNARDLAWDSIQRAILNESGAAVKKDKALEVKNQSAREEEIQGYIESNWEAIKTSIASIEGIFDQNRTEGVDMSKASKKEIEPLTQTPEMAEIYSQIEEIINSTVAKEVLIRPSNEPSDESESEDEEVSDKGYVYNFTFSMYNNKKRVLKAISRLYELDNAEIQDPWVAIKESVGNMMGDDMRDMLDKPETEYVPPNHVGLPGEFRWENYEKALKVGRHYDPNSATKRNTMYYYFLNSLVVSASAIVITILAAFMATYAMTRLVWKGRKTMNKFFMLGLTIPIHAAIVPVYMILSRLGWLNTYQALIIPYAAFSLAMAILISVGFMGDIPYDLDEAAFLDGCGIWGIFFRVIVPLMMPAVATVGIYTFLQCWNELLFATIFVSDGAYRTLPVGIQQLFGQYTTEWGPIGAALSIATIPTLIVYVALSKRIQAGFIAGAVKG